MTEEHSIKIPGTYIPKLGKDALEYLQAFTEQVELKDSWHRNSEVKECYLWCEQHLGIKYKDWYMLGRSIYFKNTKSATMFRLTWCNLID